MSAEEDNKLEVYRCERCDKPAEFSSQRCEGCGHSRYKYTSLSRGDYCKYFGHVASANPVESHRNEFCVTTTTYHCVTCGAEYDERHE